MRCYASDWCCKYECLYCMRVAIANFIRDYVLLRTMYIYYIYTILYIIVSFFCFKDEMMSLKMR